MKYGEKINQNSYDIIVNKNLILILKN